MNVLTLPFPCLHLFQLDNLDLGVWWPSLPFLLLKELTTEQVAGRCLLLTKLGHGSDMGAHKGALTGGGGAALREQNSAYWASEVPAENREHARKKCHKKR